MSAAITILSIIVWHCVLFISDAHCGWNNQVNSSLMFTGHLHLCIWGKLYEFT